MRLSMPTDPAALAPWLIGFSCEIAVLVIERLDLGGIALVESAYRNTLEGIAEELRNAAEDALPRSRAERGDGVPDSQPTGVALACRNALIEECARELDEKALEWVETGDAPTTPRDEQKGFYDLAIAYETAALDLRQMLPGFSERWELERRQFVQNCQTLGFAHACQILRETRWRSGKP
jgi:hypothetical protein